MQISKQITPFCQVRLAAIGRLFVLLTFFLLLAGHCLFVDKFPKKVKAKTYDYAWQKDLSGSPILTPRFNFDNVHVSPGSVVINDDNQIEMHYSGNDGANWRIGRATSSDGFAFSRDGFTLNIGDDGEADVGGVKDPSVVIAAESREYVMVYTAIASDDSLSLLQARSETGTSWTREGPPILTGLAGEFDSIEISSPGLMTVGAALYLYYQAFDGLEYVTGLAISNDEGATWEKQGPVIATETGTNDQNGIKSPNVFQDTIGEKFAHFYQQLDSSSVPRIGFAFSSNGTQWFKQGSFLELNGSTANVDIDRPIFAFNGTSTYWIYYAGSDGSTYRVHRSQCNGDSTECFDETNFIDNGVVLNVETTNEFDSIQLLEPALTTVPNGDSFSYRLFYTGNTGTELAVGYAESGSGAVFNRSGQDAFKKTASAFEDDGIKSPSLIELDDTYYLFYISESTTLTDSIALATGTSESDLTDRAALTLPTEINSTITDSNSIDRIQVSFDLDGVGVTVFLFDAENNRIWSCPFELSTKTFASCSTFFDATTTTWQNIAAITITSPFIYRATETPEGSVETEVEELYFVADNASGDKLIYRSNYNELNETWPEPELVAGIDFDFEEEGFSSVSVIQDIAESDERHLIYSASDGSFSYLGYMSYGLE